MNNGDVTVCGVSEDKLVEDIGVLVPKGDVVTIPGPLAHRSKDLWRLLSQGLIFQLNANSLLRLKRADSTPAPPVELEKLELETQSLRSELTKVQTDNTGLRAEVKSLKLEILRLKEEGSSQALSQAKLDEVLNLVRSRSIAPSEVRTNGTKPLSVGVEDVDESVPIFIPSKIKSDSDVTGKVSLKEGATDASSLSDASKALKGIRRKSV